MTKDDERSSRLRPAWRRTQRRVRRVGRFILAPYRVLPDFIIIGAQKSGTTSLYNYLIEHPCVHKALNKEVHYFDRNYERGELWYRTNFHLRWKKGRYEGKQCELKSGEASPYYLFHPPAPKLVKDLLPDIKMIAVLRNPVARAYSHYKHQIRKRREELSFDKALEREYGVIDDMEPGAKTYPDYEKDRYSYNNYSYIRRGLYYEQLSRWMDVFNRDQFMIINTDDLLMKTPEVYAEVLEFIGLPPYQLDTFKVYNPHKYSEMDPGLQRELSEYFDPHNRKLYDLIGDDFGWNDDVLRK